jgi:hypothetical protein
MRALFRPIVSSTFPSAIYIAFVAVFLSFILFDVLDLDGSKLPLQQSQAVTFALEPEGTKSIERTHFPALADLGFMFPSVLEADWASRYYIEKFRTSARGSNCRRYRLTFPRSSLAEPLLSA